MPERAVTPSRPGARAELARRLDSTLLRADASDEDVRELARHARTAGCAAVCVAPARLAAAARELSGAGTALAAAVAFPNGAATLPGKSFEALEALRLGATELDVVCDLDAVRRGDVGALEREMRGVMERTPEAVHKFILEVGLLPDGAWRRLAAAVRRAAPAYVKTGTGIHGGPVTVEQVRRLIEAAGPGVRVKAAGGIRTLEHAEALLGAGAARLGTSHAAGLLAAIAP